MILTDILKAFGVNPLKSAGFVEVDFQETQHLNWIPITRFYVNNYTYSNVYDASIDKEFVYLRKRNKKSEMLKMKLNSLVPTNKKWTAPLKNKQTGKMMSFGGLDDEILSVIK